MNLKEFREKLKWLDPFTYVDLYVMPKVNPGKNEAVSWIVYLASAFFFAWAIYTALGLVLGTSAPMMIVVSGSMEPLYHRGDIIVLHGISAENLNAPEQDIALPSLRETELASFAQPVYEGSGSSKHIEAIEFNQGGYLPVTKQGDIVVYWNHYLNEPIIHRVVARLKAGDGWYILTKGDSVLNTTVDQDCGYIINGLPEKACIALYPVPVQDIQGKAALQIPVLGCFKLWLLDDLGSLLATGKLPAEIKSGNIC